MTWQDWITIISLIIGLVGLIITIITLKKAGKIDRAINETKEKVVNKVKYIDKYKEYLKKLKNIYKKLTFPTGVMPSSDSLKEISIQMEDILKWLDDCNTHYKDKDKKNVTVYLNKLKEKNQDTGLCFDANEHVFLREVTSDIIHLLEKEDYVI